MSSNRGTVVLIVMTLLMVTFLTSFVTEISSADDESTSFYSQLDDNEKAIYDSISDFSADSLTVTVQLSNAIFTESTSDESAAETYIMEQISDMVEAAAYALGLEDPLAICTWGSSTVVCSADSQTFIVSEDYIGLESLVLVADMDPNYADDPDTDVNELQEKIDALNDAIDSYDAGSSDLRTIVGNINSYLTGRLSYDTDENAEEDVPYSMDAYGALVASSENVTSEGFAKGFQALCDKYGIDCYTILGYEVPDMDVHAWNIVLMGNGDWYPVDVAMNKTSSDGYLLVSSETFYTTHQFGLTPSDGGVSFDYPSLSSTKYDSDPWYEDSLVEGAFMAIIGVVLVVGIMLALREDRKKMDPKKK